MELVILAAGMGSRFGGLKQIEPMDDYGNFIIDYSIYDAIEAGFDAVTFIIKEELYNDFRETIGKRVENKIKTNYVFQKITDLPEGFVCPEGREKPWGTGHAIMAAKDVVKDSFIIINADDFYGKDAFKVAADYIRQLPKDAKGAYANVAYHTCNTVMATGSVKRGVCFADEAGNLAKMVESSIEWNAEHKLVATPLDGDQTPFMVENEQPVSMNMFVFTVDILQHLVDRFPQFLKDNANNPLKCEYLIPSIVSDLVTDGLASVKLLSTTAKWYGVTYREDKEYVVKSLKALVDEGQYKEGLWK